jgi:hypothetical protein
MGVARSVFWDDLVRDLQDPEFLRDYVVESMRIATVDRIVNELDEARRGAGLSYAWSRRLAPRTTRSLRPSSPPSSRRQRTAWAALPRLASRLHAWWLAPWLGRR